MSDEATTTEVYRKCCVCGQKFLYTSTRIQKRVRCPICKHSHHFYDLNSAAGKFAMANRIIAHERQRDKDERQRRLALIDRKYDALGVNETVRESNGVVTVTRGRVMCGYHAVRYINHNS